jgi:hypothetical protein
MLQILHGTVNNDQTSLRQLNRISKSTWTRLSEEYEKCLVGITSTLRKHGIPKIGKYR